jgi:anti-anti-sigma factor
MVLSRFRGLRVPGNASKPMQHLIEIAPVLGAYDRPLTRSGGNQAFGKPARARYATRMSDKALDWHKEQRGSATVLAPAGRVDESTADAFKERLLAAVGPGPGALVIDLAGVEYMSSRGLRALTLAQRAGQEKGATITLARPNKTMREILAISRYDMVFRIADTIEDALAN